MQSLILALLVGITTASYIQYQSPLVEDSIAEFHKGLSETGPLKDYVILHQAYASEEEDGVMQTELGKMLKKLLNTVLEEIKEKIDHGKDVAEELVKKVRELKDHLRVFGIDAGTKAKELFQKLKEHAKGALKEMLKKINMGKRDLEITKEGAYSMQLEDLVDRLKEKLRDSKIIQKIREYLLNDNSVLKVIKEAVSKLHDIDLRQLLRDILDHTISRDRRGITDIWDKLGNLGNIISDKYKRLAAWLLERWSSGFQALVEKYGPIKAVLIDLWLYLDEVGKEIAYEAFYFLKPYKEDLGDMWDNFVDALSGILGKGFDD